MAVCAICETRRPRRSCPGVRGEICSLCCGAEREVTVNCPLDCEYLQDARKHDRLPELPEDFPNKDIRITDQFLRDKEPLLMAAARALLEASLRTPGAVDFDVREALDSLIRTYRTLESGLYYETRPANPIAGNIHHLVQQRLNEVRRRLHERLGVAFVRDADVLGILVFLQRLELQQNNGRRRGRAFLDSLRRHFSVPAGSLSGGSPLIVA